MTFHIAVLADDFTGACDVGVQFAKHRLETTVLTDIKRLTSLRGEFDVLVVDTESRNLTPESAYRKVAETLKSLRKPGIRLVYKKIDSTLRGNIGSELDAVIDELQAVVVIVTPAFPAHKRTVIDGCLLLGGTLLGKTEFAQDPLNPVRESHIPTLIGGQTKRRIGHINLSILRAGVDSFKDEIRRLVKEGTQIIVADAETQDDLAKIADACVSSAILPCGSAGLAQEISRSWASGSKLLVISGSLNSVTLAQIAKAEEVLPVKVLDPDFSRALDSKGKLDSAAKNLAKGAEAALANGQDVIIRLANSKDIISNLQNSGQKLGMNPRIVADKLLRVIGKAARTIVENRKAAGLILIGGDTSIAVMDALQAEGVRIEDEVLPGIPVGRILSGRLEGVRVVTKAGGFGDSDTLVKIMRFMKSTRSL